MNSRLRELMLDAGYASPELAGRANKLAELIIKDCLSIVSAKEIFQDITEYEQGYNKALKSVYSDIIEKFGVKE